MLTGSQQGSQAPVEDGEAVIPYAWNGYMDFNMAKGRWDQSWIERMLTGEESLGLGLTFVEVEPGRVLSDGGVLVFPCGAFHDHGIKHIALKRLWDDLLKMPWGVVIATSDEGSTFEWHKIDPWPEHIQLWVMTPRPEHTYPPGTRFIGEGSPTGAASVPRALARDLDVFLSAQGGHERRDECFMGVRGSLDNDPTVDAASRYIIQRTDGFAQGLGRHDYLNLMARTWVAPAPSGPMTQDSFRAFEALECGAIPIVDGLRPLGLGRGYWEMIGMGWLPVCHDWSEAPQMIDDLLSDRRWHAARTSSLWQQYKAEVVDRLHADVISVGRLTVTPSTPDERITVIVPTSPSPLHPSLEIIEPVIQSVRAYLPTARIIIACDGVNPNQPERIAAYHEYLYRLTQWCLPQRDVIPVVFGEWLHQSGMMKRLIGSVTTEYVAFIEGDCTLEGDIDMTAVLAEMETHDLNHMRFLHETKVLDGYRYLFLESEPRPGTSHVRTIQFSTRPAIIRTAWMRETMATYFSDQARTMIEDVMYKVWLHGYVAKNHERHPAEKGRAAALWQRHRGAVWASTDNLLRSRHLDNRREDPKYDMIFDYPDERPPGAPTPIQEHT